MVNAAAENKEAYREPACTRTRTCRGKPNTGMTAAPSKTLMTTASLLGFYDPGHFGGEGDFYNSIFIFSSPSLLVSERLCTVVCQLGAKSFMQPQRAVAYNSDAYR